MVPCELPALLTSSDGSVHALTGSLEDVLYEAPSVMHKSVEDLPSTSAKVPVCDETTGKESHPSPDRYQKSPAQQQVPVDPSIGETKQLRQDAWDFPLAGKVASDSSGSCSPEKECHDPVSIVACSPRSSIQDVQKHPTDRATGTGAYILCSQLLAHIITHIV